jgi:hypothetical protein
VHILFVGKVGGIGHNGPKRRPSHPSFIRQFLEGLFSEVGLPLYGVLRRAPRASNAR